MRTVLTPRAWRGTLVSLLLLSAAPAALAQLPANPAPGTVQALPSPDDPAEKLAQALRTLAVQPNDVAALTAAGTNAVALGDPNAAVGFLGRAAGIAPNNGAVKAGLGSALVQLEKPQDALRLFAEASRLGVPERDLAEDRGLAYDLIGDPRRAQRDYALVLASRPDDDVARRRLALSQGISGDRAAAIATLDPLIRKRDIAAWRAQTFVLAMNGDAKGAGDITRIMMPSQSAMLQPFLLRLASLSPADKAKAVHFGEMPASGSSYGGTQVAALAASAARPASPPPASDLAPVAQAPAQPVRTARRAATPAAPLAGIALGTAPATAAQIAPAPATAPASQQVELWAPRYLDPSAPPATAMPASTASAQPATSASALPPLPVPGPATSGHYDLPHVAAERSGARPILRTPVPPSVPAQPAARTITPVEQEAASAAPAPATVATATPAPVAAPKPVERKPALTEAAPARLALAKPKPVPAAEESEESGAPLGSKSRKVASADAPARTKPIRAKSKPVVPAADDEEESAPASAKGKGHALASPKGRLSAAAADEDADSASTPKTKGKSGKLAAKDSATTKSRSGRAATDDEEDATPAKGRKGAKLAAAEKEAPAKGKGRSAKASDADDEDAGTPSRHGKAVGETAGGRVYVQVAGGANREDMDKAWAGVKKKAPDLMKGQKPSTMPVRATNRLVVGPFKSDEEAQAFVNKMAAKGLSGFTVKSSKGQKVEKIDAGS